MLRFAFAFVSASAASITVDSDRALRRKLRDCFQMNIHDPVQAEIHAKCSLREFSITSSGGRLHHVVFRESLGTGAIGNVLMSEDGLYAMKIPERSVNVIIFVTRSCREKLLIDYVIQNGFGGLVPRLFSPINIPKVCNLVMMVMDNVGPLTLGHLVTSEGGILARYPKIFRDVSIKMIEIIRSLHEIGVFHDDCHVGNFMFSNGNDIAGSLKIIDFGQAGLLKESGRVELARRWDDMRKTVDSIVFLGTDRHGYVNPKLKQIQDEIRAVATLEDEWIEEPPIYSAWIEAFSNLPERPPRSDEIPVDETDERHIDWRAVEEVWNILEDEISLEEHLSIKRELARNYSEEKRRKRIDDFFSSRGIRWTTDKSHSGDAGHIGIWLLETLERMHDSGYVYGNLSLRNLIDKADENGVIELDKTGFGHLFVTSDKKYLSPRRVECPNMTKPSIATPGGLSSFCPTRYDDLFRLASVLFDMMGVRDNIILREISLDTMRQRVMSDDIPFSKIFNSFYVSMFEHSLNRAIHRPDYSYWIGQFKLIVN